jgi:hypothetical protein
MHPHCKDVYGQLLKLHNYVPLIRKFGFIQWNYVVPHEEHIMEYLGHKQVNVNKWGVS